MDLWDWLLQSHSLTVASKLPIRVPISQAQSSGSHDRPPHHGRHLLRHRTKPTAHDDAVPIAPEPNTVHAPKMPAPPLQRPRRGHIPQEDLLVTSDAGKARIIVRHRQVEDLVAVGRVGLHEARFGNGGGGLERVVQMDGSVGGASQDLPGAPR